MKQVAQARWRRLRSQTKAITASTAAIANKPVDASISGTLATLVLPTGVTPLEPTPDPTLELEADDPLEERL